MKKILLSSFASLLAFGLMAQVEVSKQVEKKWAVLEDLTGDQCGWCPNGQDYADRFKKARNGDMIIIANHEGGFSTGILEVPSGVIIGNVSGATGWPAGNINRRVWTGTKTAHGRGGVTADAWKANIEAIEKEDSPVNIAVEASYASGSDELNIYVSLYYTEDVGKSNYINVAILQDEVLSPQSGATGTYGYPARIDPATGLYRHMDLLRDYVTKVKFSPKGYEFGDEITKTGKDEGSVMEFTWTIPAKVKTFDVVKEDLKVVVFVTEDSDWSEIYTGRETYVGMRPTGIEEAASLKDLEIYPNPFQTNATVKFNLESATQLQVNVFDMTGKMVQNVPTTVYSAGATTIDIDGSGLNNGIYYVNIVAEDGVITRKLILNR